jgi:hypothetical protein
MEILKNVVDPSTRSRPQLRDLSGLQLPLAILRIGEAIPYAGFGEDIARPGGRGFDFASQLADKDVQVLDILFVTGAPDLFE